MSGDEGTSQDTLIRAGQALGVDPDRTGVRTTWTVRLMHPATRDAIRELGEARGWTVAETLEHMIAFVKDAQFLADEGSDSSDLRVELLNKQLPGQEPSWLQMLLEHHRLAYVKL